MLVQVESLEIENLENAGCNNGNYPLFTAKTVDGEIIHGMTCSCGAGCSNTTAVAIDYSVNPPTYWVELF